MEVDMFSRGVIKMGSLVWLIGQDVLKSKF